MAVHPEYIFPTALTNSTSQACTQLLNHARLVQLTHHRNKNQHRRSAWYRHFSLFRRELLKLCRQDLGLALLSLPSTGPAQVDLRLRGKRATAGAKAVTLNKATEKKTKSEMRDCARARIQNWLEHDFPQRWYTAFTSLAATPSFTPLSLTLTALLARVCALLGVTSHIKAIAKHQEGEKMVASNEFDATGEEMDEKKQLLRGYDGLDRSLEESGEDLGVVVQRPDSDMYLHPSRLGADRGA